VDPASGEAGPGEGTSVQHSGGLVNLSALISHVVVGGLFRIRLLDGHSQWHTKFIAQLLSDDDC
jgi:hypothetical protein